MHASLFTVGVMPLSKCAHMLLKFCLCLNMMDSKTQCSLHHRITTHKNAYFQTAALAASVFRNNAALGLLAGTVWLPTILMFKIGEAGQAGHPLV